MVVLTVKKKKMSLLCRDKTWVCTFVCFVVNVTAADRHLPGINNVLGEPEH